MQGPGEERTALDPRRSAPDRHEIVDKTAVLTSLVVLGLGIVFLSAMLFLLFPEWIHPRAFATEASPSPISIVTLRAPASFEDGQVAAGAVSALRRPVSRGTAAGLPEPTRGLSDRAVSERWRAIAAKDATRNLRAAEITDAVLFLVGAPLPSSPLPSLGLPVEPLPSVVSSVKQIITGTIVAIGNGSLTLQTANGLVIVNVGYDTTILADGQLRSLRDVAVGQSIAVLGAALDATGISGPVVIDRTSTDTQSGSGAGVGVEATPSGSGAGVGIEVNPSGSGVGVGIEVKGTSIGVKLP